MILDNAEQKIQYFNKIGVHYEAVYYYLIRNRYKTPALFTPQLIDDITAGLISFDMQRMMGKRKYLTAGKSSWATQLVRKLVRHKNTLNELKDSRLESLDFTFPALADKVVTIFDELAKKDSSGLNFSSPNKGFQVGASKILHFLIPDLFIIIDSNARAELAKHHGFNKYKKIDGKRYVAAMQLYQKELSVWAKDNSDPDFSSLIALDASWQHHCGERPTPLPRIIDKCTFSGDRPLNRNQYLPLEFRSFFGGFLGPSYKLELYGDTLVHTEYSDGFKLEKSTVFDPPEHMWASFRNQIDELGIWEWNSEYKEPGIMDGIQWSVNIKYDDNCIKSRGENQFPEARKAAELSVFDGYLEAVRNLVGGCSFH
jgi:hypothetical protein